MEPERPIRLWAMTRTDRTSEAPRQFRYYLHAWRREPTSGLRRCNELYATDGRRVRTMRSRGSFVTYDELEERRAAQTIVDAIESQWQPDAPLMGYRALSDQQRVAIVRRGDGDGRWAVFPCDEQSFPRQIPSRPADLDTGGSRVHLLGGATLGWRGATPVVQGALEVRSWGKTATAEQTRLLEAVEMVELRATAERRGEIEEIALVPKSSQPQRPSRASQVRVEFEFPLEKFVYGNYRNRPSFRPWFVLECSRELFDIPETWRRFWMTVELTER